MIDYNLQFLVLFSDNDKTTKIVFEIESEFYY